MTAPATTTPAPSASNPMPDLYSRRLSDRLQFQQKQIQTLTRAQRVSQLGFSSIEDEWVNMYDASAQLAMRLGKQEDGTYAVQYKEGTPPPTPSDPLVSPGEGSIKVGWNATWAVAGTVPPVNLARVDIHMSLSANFVVGPSTCFASLPPTGGVETIPASNTDWYVKLVAVTNAEVKGGASGEVRVLPLPFTTIAAYSIGAEQLMSKIILASRLIIGDPTSRRFEMEPNAGFQVFNTQNVRTFWQDTDTGDLNVYARLLAAPLGSTTNIVMGEPDSSGRNATLKFTTGSPFNGKYTNSVQMISSSTESIEDSSNVALMRMFGAEYRRAYGTNNQNRETVYSKAFMSFGQTIRFGVGRWSTAGQDDTDTQTELMGIRILDKLINIGGSTFRNVNDNWQPSLYMPYGEYVGTLGAGSLGWYTRGSGTEFYVGMKFYCPGGSQVNGRASGPDFSTIICSQPDVRVRNHTDTAYVPLYASSAGPPSSMTMKNSVELGPMSPDSMLASLRQVVPAYYHYDNEDASVIERIGKHYGFIAEDFHDAGLGWLVNKTGMDEDALDYFGVVAWLANCVRALDEELDVLRRGAKVESPRREKRVRGKRGNK